MSMYIITLEKPPTKGKMMILRINVYDRKILECPNKASNVDVVAIGLSQAFPQGLPATNPTNMAMTSMWWLFRGKPREEGRNLSL